MKRKLYISGLCFLTLLLAVIHPIDAIGIYHHSSGTWYIDSDSNNIFSAGIDQQFQFGAPNFKPVLGDWNGDGRNKIGVYNDGAWYLDYDGSGTWSDGDKVYYFGAPGWINVTGDWNNDGRTDIGITNGQQWYLDMNNNGAFNTGVDKVYNFGAPGWTPVLGDWNATGSSYIGITNGQQWYLDWNGNGAWDGADKVYNFGAPGWAPVLCDWNGDGKTEIGVSNGQLWYLDWNGNGTWDGADKVYNFGAPGWTPVIGDWNGDGVYKIGVFKDGIWYLDYTGEGTWTANDKVFSFGTTGDSPIILKLIEIPAPPVAAFTSDKQSGTAPLSITFTDQSTGTTPMTYAWDFSNDGSVDSTQGSPSHIYTAAGTYTVKLTVTNGAGSDTELKTRYITVIAAPSAPTADFISNKQSGTAPLTVTFTDQSTGTTPMTYAWDFDNDGVNESISKSPTFTYSNPGTYSVKLTTTNDLGSDTELKTGYITVNPVIKPTAAFTANKQSGTTPLTVRFTDQSTGTTPMTYAWDFNNDGINESTTQNPYFTYTNTGTYSVKLTATNSAGSDAEIMTDYITVTPVIGPTASFTANKQSGTTPLTVRFTDQSTGTTPMTYAWDFNNDGINESTTQNPYFTYTNTGTYSVKLTTTNSAGSDAEIMTDYITVNEAQPGSTHAGIALTFDDNAVTNWYAIQDLLKKYNAHATFYVSSFGGRSEDEINMLKTMKENGHEIAFHGAHHTDVNEYLSDHSIEEYLNYEIIPGIDLMKNAGLDPVDFAYPYGSENDDVTAVLETYFIHIRGTAYHGSGKLKDVDSVFYQYGSNEAHIYGIGIDDITYGNSLDDIYEGILRAKNEEKILIFYAHTPIVSNPQSYQISHDRLEKILINASENDMKFYKISEIN